ncbi:MAG: hypothetical protein L6Q99_09800 [Planctomycetes bacterium]|nr:hypothetical protein [Planctomycetota bacterium]
MLGALFLSQVLAAQGADAQVELDPWIERLPPHACERHLDEHEKPTEAPAVAELRRAVEARALSDEQWRRALVASGAIRWRKRWPIDRPFAVSLAEPRWLAGELGSRARLTVVPRIIGWRDATAGTLDVEGCGIAVEMRLRAERTQVLGPLAHDLQVVPCSVHVMRVVREPAPSNRARTELVWQGTLDLDVEPVTTLEESLPGAHDAELDRAVAASFAASLVVRSESEPSLWVHWVPDPTLHPELADLGVSLDVELREGPRVHARTELDVEGEWSPELHHARPGCGPWDTRHGASGVKPSPRALREAPADFSGWTVVVRGTSKSVVAQWDAARYWDGSFEVPLADALAPRTDPWWFVPVGRRPAQR